MKYFLLLTSFAILGITFQLTQKTEQDTVYYESETKSLEALAWIAQIHDYPNQSTPDGRFYESFLYFKEHYLNSNKARLTDEGEWENIGPNNVGGRTISIAIHPIDTNIIFLGSASGGLWKTTTGGIGVNAWQYVETGYPILGVSAIALNPDNPDEIYIGTGETYAYGKTTNGLIDRTERGTFGMGILKSQDGGANWEINLNWTYQLNRCVWDIVFDPFNTDQLYAATTEGLYKTTNGGLYWSQRLDEFMVMDIEVNKLAPHVLFAGVGDLNSTNKGLYRSENYGETWELMDNGLPPYTHDGRIMVTSNINNASEVITVIANAFSTVGIYKSTNGGDSWFELDDADVASYQGWYAKGALIHHENPNLILLGGVELFKSINGGNVFVQKTTYTGPDSEMHPDIHDIIANPLDPDKVYILTDGGLFRSNDFGETFFSCNDGYVTSQFYIGSISAQTNDKGLGGLQDNFTQRYDGSKYWDAIIGGDGSFNAIRPDDDEIQFASYQYGVVYKSNDGGNNFDEFVFSPTGDAAFVTPFVLCPSDPESMYIGDTKLHYSNNSGGSFSLTSPSLIDSGNVVLSIGVSGLSIDTVYISTAGLSGRADMFISTNGGDNYTTITNGLPDRYYRDIAVNPNNANELYITLSGYGTGHVYRSMDAGNNWVDVSESLPDMPFHSVAIDPSNDSIVYVGCDFGVFVSFDKGTSWENFGTGLPEAVMVFDLVFSSSDNMLLAFTHGNGVYRIPQASKPAQVSIDNFDDLSITLTPNPVADYLNVNISEGRYTHCTAIIVNGRGEVVFQKNDFTLENRMSIYCKQLASGIYFLVLENNQFKHIEKFIKTP